jgi:septum formation protein
MHELILTSQSPRRRQLLQEMGLQFCIFPIEISEILNKNLSLPEQISNCAQQKVQAALHRYNELKSQGFLCLGADTEVVFQGQCLGKPKNEQHATNILTQLSGQVHSVITGFCLYDTTAKRFILGHEETKVHFKTLDEKSIFEYVATGDPMDKAGAYGIQSGAGHFVDRFEGSLNNVIGLPTERLQKEIESNGWQLKK